LQDSGGDYGSKIKASLKIEDFKFNTLINADEEI
jgi:hypothetical protein